MENWKPLRMAAAREPEVCSISETRSNSRKGLERKGEWAPLHLIISTYNLVWTNPEFSHTKELKKKIQTMHLIFYNCIQFFLHVFGKNVIYLYQYVIYTCVVIHSSERQKVSLAPRGWTLQWSLTVCFEIIPDYVLDLLSCCALNLFKFNPSFKRQCNQPYFALDFQCVLVRVLLFCAMAEAMLIIKEKHLIGDVYSSEV